MQEEFGDGLVGGGDIGVLSRRLMMKRNYSCLG